MPSRAREGGDSDRFAERLREAESDAIYNPSYSSTGKATPSQSYSIVTGHARSL